MGVSRVRSRLCVPVLEPYKEEIRPLGCLEDYWVRRKDWRRLDCAHEQCADEPKAGCREVCPRRCQLSHDRFTAHPSLSKHSNPAHSTPQSALDLGLWGPGRRLNPQGRAWGGGRAWGVVAIVGSYLDIASEAAQISNSSCFTIVKNSRHTLRIHIGLYVAWRMVPQQGVSSEGWGHELWETCKVAFEQSIAAYTGSSMDLCW